LECDSPCVGGTVITPSIRLRRERQHEVSKLPENDRSRSLIYIEKLVGR